MRKTLFAIAASSLLSISALSQSREALWLRDSAISPDGAVIAFTYKGDIYTVPVGGGEATRITTASAVDSHPVWSPDGSKLAFASDRDGGVQIYVTSRQGGEARSITFNNSRSQKPVAFYDNETVIFESNIRPAANMGLFPYGSFTQLYTQRISGGRPMLYSATTMSDVSIGADGRILYADVKGYEDPLRKHHISPIARDIWLWSPGSGAGTYTKLTTFGGEDRNPVWLPGQEAFLYTSEQNGDLNVYRASAAGGTTTQLTHFTKHPVRSLTVDQRGNAAFSWNGKLYYMPANGAAQELKVTVTADYTTDQTIYQTITRGAVYAQLSPNEKEVAFIVRGDVFVTNIEYGTTRRITNTAEQERELTISPDGRQLVYSAERNGQWNLYMTEIVRSDEDQFVYAAELRETQLTNSQLPSFNPKFSPDGKEIAFLRDRTAICVLNLATKAERTVLNKQWNYSYSDGDQWFDWAPDSKWIITNYIGIGGWNNVDVAAVKADATDHVVNLTESGYSDGGGKAFLGGKAVIFDSDRSGYRSHGSWGSESDLYIMFLDQEAYDTYWLNKEERALAKGKEKKEETNDDTKDANQKEKSKKAESKVPDFVPDFKNRELRTFRLTRVSSSISDFVMDDKGEKLYYIAQIDGQMNLYCYDIVKKDTEMILEDAGWGSLKLAKDGETLYLFGGKGMKKIANGRPTAISFAAKFEYKPTAERTYIFDHVVKQVENKFYDATLHGIDWAGYAANYRAFLPHINNDSDFAILLSELLGELNASHTGARAFGRGATNSTASLGLFYDDSYQGEGVRVLEVMAGGPLDKAKTAVKEGVIIHKINGTVIAADKPIDYYLRGLAGQRTRLSIIDHSGKEVEEYITPMAYGAENELLYERWVRQRAEMVHKWSNGRIGYVHIEGMDSPSFRRIYRELLGKYRGCDAVVVDTRFNGGGWLHADVATLLSGREFARFMPRGQYIGSEPFNRWYKPSVILMSEGNYSDAHGTPWTYKTLGIGKLVGTPVAGTMTAVWWETQINPNIVFGIPQVTVKDMQGQTLENTTLQPDILVYNTPEQNLANYDAQLKAAVDELLRQVSAQPNQR